jgi:hypothetical protein
VALVCVEHFYEQWICVAIKEAVDASVIRPDNPDIISPEAADRHHATTILEWKRKAPQSVRGAINKFLITLGWGTPFLPNDAEHTLSSEAIQPLEVTNGQTIDVGGTTVTDVTSLQLPVAQAQDTPAIDIVEEHSITMSVLAVDELERPATPLSPTLINPRHNDADPRIRITSREGIVEMEVRLPSRILSTHTEVADVVALSQTERPVQQRHEALAPSDRPYHRVSQLSLESSQMVSAIVREPLDVLAVLPFRLLVLRLIASHYLASKGGHAIASRVVRPLPSLRGLSWSSVGTQLSRIALCCALEVAIDLGLWGLQYATALNIGKSLFGWGTL